jgi:hypothetical protein
MRLRDRRQFLHLAAGAAALPAVSRIAWGQADPTRSVRIMIGFAAGGYGNCSAELDAADGYQGIAGAQLGKTRVSDRSPQSSRY